MFTLLRPKPKNVPSKSSANRFVLFRRNVSVNEYQDMVDKVLTHLEAPFARPVHPEWGPVFPRKQWEEDFMDKMNSKAYLLYHGSSGCGKSVAVSNALVGRKGVVYSRFNNGRNTFQALRRAIGLEEDDGKRHAHYTVLSAFAGACEVFTHKEKQKPVLIVDNFHLFTEEDLGLVSDFVQIHNDGHLNVVYTTSEYGAARTLRDVSGHADRLTVKPFPNISDTEFIDTLSHMTVNTKKEYHVESKNPQNPPVVPRDKAEHIVKYFGSHMQDVAVCLRQYVERGKSLEECIQDRIRSSDKVLGSVLAGHPTTIIDLDRHTFIATAHTLFDLLSSKKDTASVLDVPRRYPQVEDDKVLDSTDRLVDLNLLAYLDDEMTVQLGSRKLKWAYEELLKNEFIAHVFTRTAYEIEIR